MEPNTEVRLGLVMYGGVSLAVYINGVAQEFFQAVRGKGIYDLIGKLTDSKITVDIISGTSAGGINGIFLAYALANNKNFEDMASLWRERADISKLLQDPRLGPENSKSLLDCKVFYHNSLVEAFKGMQDLPIGEDLHTQEIDLFVTGTNIDGNRYTTFDEMGHPIDIKNHRTVFILKHRKGRKEPFNSQNTNYYAKPEVAYQALSKLARITSCFPAAFEPVVVENVPAPAARAAYSSEDQCLKDWGDIRNKAVFMDGGILDNKPFSYTIDAIFSRSANTDIERYLCYVEPDPESFKPADSKEPTFVQATIKGGLTITSYESIADDLASIRRHNSQIERYNRLCTSLKGKVGNSPGVVPELDSTNPSMMIYVRSRFNAIADRAIEGLLKEKGQRLFIQDTTQREQATALIKSFNEWKGDGRNTLERYDVYFRLRRLFHVIYQIKEELFDKERVFADYQPDQNKRDLWKALNHQVEVFQVIQYWMEYAVDNLPIRWVDAAGKVRPLEEIWDDVTTTMRWILNVQGVPEKLGPEYSKATLTAPHDLFDQDAITRIHLLLSSRWQQLSSQSEAQVPGPDRFGDKFKSLVVWMDEFAAKTFAAYGDGVQTCWEEFNEFLSLDAVVYPLEALAEIQTKDIIRTVRFSPTDAQKAFSKRDLSLKLSGDAFAHFAGFFKRSWRSNDILWGRLDGLCQLTELLFCRSRLKAISDRDDQRTRIRTAIGINGAGSPDLRVQLESTFRNAGSATIERIVKWLERLFSNTEADRVLALKEFDEHQILLISMAQLDIIKSDVPKVIEDAIFEQSRWNEFRVAKEPDLEAAARIAERSLRAVGAQEKKGTGFDVAKSLALVLGPDPKLVLQYYKQSAPAQAQAPQEQAEIVREAIRTTLPAYDASRRGFVPAVSRIDPLVITVAAEHYAAYGLNQFAEDGRNSPDPAYTRLGQFFSTNYRVGTETIVDEIPKLVLLEMFSKASLVLKNCVLGSLRPEVRAQVESNVVFRWLFDIPPRILLAISTSLREDSSLTIAIKSAITVLAVAAFVVGVIYWDPLIYHPGSGFTLKWFLSLLVVPPIGLYVLWLTKIQRVVGWAMAGIGGLATGGLTNLEFVHPNLTGDALGFHMAGVALQLAGTAGRAKPLIDVLRPDLLQSLAIDSHWFVPAYLLIFTAFGVWFLVGRSTKLRWMGAVICGLVLGAASADLVENSRIAALAELMTDAAAQNVQIASRIKWAVLAIALLSVAMSSAGVVRTAFKQRKFGLVFAAAGAVLSGFAAAAAGLWGVYRLSAVIEYSLIGLALTTTFMGITMAVAQTRKS